MKVKEIAFVCYAIENVPKAREFYEKFLSLVPTQNWESEEYTFIEYSFGPEGSHTLALGKGVPNFKPGKSGATVALEVEDFDGAVATLKSNSVPFILEPQDTPVCHMALVADPDGNQIMIHKRKEDKKA